eukprot:TRINITY_DN7394_c0_g1_i1.p1 TRINITY_DN7394_c0_g1~~TRINITY_DN7394_c0_g1_i1.p1  ORF type:complete len:953 (+),score=370.20 TRINITY_DN7394_c0_g1_i1:61-2859(+)
MIKSVLSILLLLLVAYEAQAAVMGIDLGSQWYKMTVVKSGVGFTVVLNDQSSRKTHTLVGWNRDERVLSSDAYGVQSRFPSLSYPYITSVIGKPYGHPAFEENKEWISYKIEENTNTHSIQIPHNSNTTFTPEDLLAMILRRAAELALVSVGSPVRDVVITVPPYLTQHERQAILDAADVAGLNVLSLINDISAFALSYALDRNFENNTQNVIFYDIGATSAKALLCTLSAVPDIKSKKNKTITQVLVHSTTWDNTVGGKFIDRNLVNHFKKAIQAKYADIDISDPRLTVRLFKEAQKVKEILSSNQQAPVQIVGLGDYDDLTMIVTRSDFEAMNADIFKRAIAIIDPLLTQAGFTKEEINYVEIVGGITRIPKIQADLKAFLSRDELDRHVNGDEGASTGAAYFAAATSPSFRAKDIKFRDITQFPVEVKINTEDDISSVQEDEDDHEEDKDNTVLFKATNKLNTKKTLTFYTNNNFSLDLSYSSSDSMLPDHSLKQLAHIEVTGVPSAQKYNMTSRPKIHCSFKLSYSGIVSLEHAEAEITYLLPPKPKAVKPTPATEKPATSSSSSEESTTEETTTATKKDESSTDDTTTESTSDEKKEGDVDSSTTEETRKTESEPEVEKEPKKKTIKVPLKIVVQPLGIISLDSSSKSASKQKLAHFDWLDEQKRELQREKNNLESYLYDTRDKLELDEVIEASTEAEREAVRSSLSSGSDWLMENEDSATTAEFRAKMKEVRETADKIFFRMKEATALPASFDDLHKSISASRLILRNLTDIYNVTEEEKDRALKITEDAADWLSSSQSTHSSLAKHDDPVITSFQVLSKKYEVEANTKLMLRKPKKKKPAPVKKPKTTTTKDDDDDEAPTTPPSTHEEDDVKVEDPTATSGGDTIPPHSDDHPSSSSSTPEETTSETQEENQETTKSPSSVHDEL